MSFFDINVAIGRFARPVGAAFDQASALQGELKRLGIAEALVCHALASEGDVVLGNRLLLEAVEGHGNLYPCWVMCPPYLGDVPDPEWWVAEARDYGVYAARLFPLHSLYPLEDWCVGPLLNELERANMPVLLDFGPRHWSQTLIPWGSIRTLAQTYPDLSFIVLGATVGDARAIESLLYAAQNVYFEYHAFMPPDMLEHVSQNGFAKQFVFGTGLPRRAAECVVGQTLLGGLANDERVAVTGDTARTLLGIESTARMCEPLPLEAVFADVPVIDVHGHIGSWERTTAPVKGPEAFVRSMDRCGIAQFVFSSFAAIHGETTLGNREAAEAVTSYPDRLFAYVVVNPNYPEDSLADVHHYLDGPSNFVGLKFHCYLHGAQLHDSGYAPSLSYADEHALAVLVHGGGRDEWDNVCAKYPRTQFIIAHACAWDGLDPDGRVLYERVRTTPNLHVDLSGSAAHRGALRKLIDLVGADKILYGSDFPMFDFAWELARVTLSDIRDDEKRLICGDNARRIFKRLRYTQALGLHIPLGPAGLPPKGGINHAIQRVTSSVPHCGGQVGRSSSLA
ncbi:MAG: amidohydrolase family protein [Candidatus Hydrogenedentes bacterium]|nr:amidohydrolase family protein [Candidatus Hydrogenedentota bacterium]